MAPRKVEAKVVEAKPKALSKEERKRKVAQLQSKLEDLAAALGAWAAPAGDALDTAAVADAYR